MSAITPERIAECLASKDWRMRNLYQILPEDDENGGVIPFVLRGEQVASADWIEALMGWPVGWTDCAAGNGQVPSVVATAWRLLSSHTPGVVEMGNAEHPRRERCLNTQSSLSPLDAAICSQSFEL